MRMVAITIMSVLGLFLTGGSHNVVGKYVPLSVKDFEREAKLIAIVRVTSIDNGHVNSKVKMLAALRGEIESGVYVIRFEPKPWVYGELKIERGDVLVVFLSKVEDEELMLSHPRAVARFSEDLFDE